MEKLDNDLLLRALRCEPTERTPVWIMRQAGRYLPEYRAVRKRAGSFMDLCRSAAFATEVTMQPLERFSLDAAILFSDILTIPDAMGLGLHFVEGEGPKFERPIGSEADVAKLGVPDMELDLGYVMNAVRSIKSALRGRVPLIGFSGSPWTLASYMVEGQSTREFKRVKGLMYESPECMHRLLGVLAEAVFLYLKAQVLAGVNLVQVFDTWGGQLAYDAYHEFSLAYMSQIVSRLKADQQTQRVPVILFTKGGGVWLEGLVASGADGLGFDWALDLGQVSRALPATVAIQGNLDPAILRAPDTVIEQSVDRVLDGVGTRPGHIFNLGHGITPDIKPEALGVLVSRVAAKSQLLRSGKSNV